MLSRMKQSVKEKTGREVAKTSYDASFEEACRRVDVSKEKTERFLDKLKLHIASMGDVGGKGVTRVEAVGAAEVEYGQALTLTDPALSAILTNSGNVLQRFGPTERTYQKQVEEEVAAPLREWLKGYCEEYRKQKDLLGKRRLEMDAAANKAISKKGPEAEAAAAEAKKKHESQLETLKAHLALLPRHLSAHALLFKKFLSLHKELCHNAATSIAATLDKL